MDWRQLISEQRFSPAAIPSAPTASKKFLTTFQEDIERIVYSSSFRRLQGKTQVYPLPKSDYFRTRLTHTIEVSQVGRAIGTTVCRILMKGGHIFPADFHPSDMGDLVSAACLAHDIGNPPFGHIGEDAIRSWFNTNGPRVFKHKGFSDESKKQDFLQFDGNAHGFRQLTRLQGWRNEGGLQLTNTTLAAFSKYPYLSSSDKSVNVDYVKVGKFGSFSSESSYLSQVFESLCIKKLGAGCYFRHPLSFISEAADDICYLTTDIEDGVKSGAIDFLRGEKILKEIASGRDHAPRYGRLANKGTADKISYLRSGAVSSLIEECIDTFVENISGLFDGNESCDIISMGKFSEQSLEIRRLANSEIYYQKDKIETESAGFSVIYELLDLLSEMVDDFLDNGFEKMSKRNKNIFYLLPHDDKVRMKQNGYDAYMHVVDFICGMTDRYSLELYQKIRGISPLISRML